MTRRRVLRNGRSGEGGKFVQLPEWVLACPAYRALDATARALLVEIKRLYNGSNNGTLAMGVRRAAEAVGVSKDRAARALKDLERHGFIRARQRGSFNWKSRRATEWVLTEYEYAGQLAMKDFARWQPPEKSEHGPAAEDIRSLGAGPCAN